MSRPVALDHDQLVQFIYDGADDPEGLRPAMQRLGELVDSPQGQLLVLDRGGTLLDNSFYGPPARVESAEDYTRHWQPQDPRFAAALRRPNQLLSDTRDIDREAFERSAIHNEYLMQTGTEYALFGNFFVGDSLIAGTAFLRSPGSDPFGERERERLQSILPHLTRAVRLRHLASALREARDDLHRTLDASPAPLLLLDGRGRVVATSALAESLLRPADSLRTERGVLTCARPDEARRLAVAIARAAILADASAGRPARTELPDIVEISRSGDVSLSVVLSPLRPRSAWRERGAHTTRVLAIVHDPTRVVRLRHDLVVRLHGLTATEAHIAVALAEGQSLVEIATTRGISEQTARTHLKRILDKTGTRRQAELVRALLTGIALHQAR